MEERLFHVLHRTNCKEFGNPSLRSYQETHLSVTDFNDILGRDFAHLVHPFDGYAIGTQVSVC